MRIHLAGLDSNINFIKLAGKEVQRYRLCSYFQTRDWTETKNKLHADTFNEYGTEMIIDSGLFTMMFGAGKGGTYDMAFMESYADRYLKDVKSYGFKNITAVECDVHKILGMPSVFELRKRFKDSGLPIIYVWHVEEGIDGLLRLAESENYIAISVPELRIFFKGKGVNYRAGVFDLLKRISIHCGKKIPKIHLLGNTIEATMRNHIAYSCDSTSWLSGVRYGNAIIYRNGKLLKVHARSKAFQDAKAKLINERPDVVDKMNSICGDDAPEYYFNLFVAAESYRLYQEWLDKNYDWRRK